MKRQQPPLSHGLPVGISPSNEMVKGSRSSWKAPNVSTPEFFPDTASNVDVSPPQRLGRPLTEEEARKKKDEERKKRRRDSILFLVVAVVFVAVFLIIAGMVVDRRPLCADQADWNQYNCRTS